MHRPAHTLTRASTPTPTRIRTHHTGTHGDVTASLSATALAPASSTSALSKSGRHITFDATHSSPRPAPTSSDPSRQGTRARVHACTSDRLRGIQTNTRVHARTRPAHAHARTQKYSFARLATHAHARIHAHTSAMAATVPAEVCYRGPHPFLMVSMYTCL